MTTLVISIFFGISTFAYDIEINGLQYDVLKKAKTASLVYCNQYVAPKDIVIPSTITFEDVECNVTSIKFGAFYGCSEITSVTIPNSITSIEGKAFSECHNLKSIVIPNSITSIEDETFWACKNLKSVTLSENLSTIGKYAFSCCWNMVSLTIPNSVKSIGEYAFWKCANLTYLTLPNSLETIEKGTFDLCESLRTIEIPNSVTTIKENAFSECKRLATVKIPNTITSIESSVFSFCYELTDFYCYAENVPNTSSFAFNLSHPEHATLHVPASSIDEYKKTAPWYYFGKIVAIEDTGTETPKCATPIVTYTDGKLQFTCDTEGAKCYYTLSNSDVKNNDTLAEENTVIFDACYNISFYAKADGYTNSDTATAKLYWLTSSGTLEGDNINSISMRGIAIQSAGGFINISGLDNNEKVSFYGLDGKALGSATAIDGKTSFSAQSGTVVVAKIGRESIKIAVE